MGALGAPYELLESIARQLRSIYFVNKFQHVGWVELATTNDFGLYSLNALCVGSRAWTPTYKFLSSTFGININRSVSPTSIPI